MAHQTPWQANSSNSPGSDSPPRRLEFPAVSKQSVLDALRRNWVYLCAAIGSIITIDLMFDPWIVTGAADGRVTATPFGKFEVSTSLVGLWSGAPSKGAQVNGMWAILATIFGVVTILAVAGLLLNLQDNARLFSRVAAGASVAMAFFTVCTIVHMNTKLGEVRNLVAGGPPRDLGTQVGMIIRWASGNGSYPVPGLRKISYVTASLATTAWYAGAAALIAAVAAVAQWGREHREPGTGIGSFNVRLPWRISIMPVTTDHTPAPPSTSTAEPAPQPATPPPPAAPKPVKPPPPGEFLG